MIALSTDRGPVLATISTTVASRAMTVREDRKLTRAAVAEAARVAGAPGSFTAAALRNIETGRRGEVSVDELVWLAAALEVSPAELIDDEFAALFGAERPAAPERAEPIATLTCARCTARAGGIQAAVRDDVEAMGDLEGVEPSLAATAYRLAQAIDDGGGEDGRLMPALAKELRSTLKELADGRRDDTGGDELDDLASA